LGGGMRWGIGCIRLGGLKHRAVRVFGCRLGDIQKLYGVFIDLVRVR
jgi:hypothetical protein